ncbi:MAG: DEAD/DEAH box helicase [Thermoguttaceae bacterium]|nr:DEAD/DEAH box helicase [Thermoguttaceae bacterium]MDW8078324.1 DEAD/DEAH box helicase [Thermoguttaceae bacterium]
MQISSQADGIFASPSGLYDCPTAADVGSGRAEVFVPLQAGHGPQLFPYQWTGVRFLLARSAALLADEMGLGKTAQTLVALQILVSQGQVQRALLVAPKSLLTNWQRELARWAPTVRTQLIAGLPAQRRWLWQHSQATLQLVHYELLVHDARYLERWASQGLLWYDLVILDEAQRIKNPTARASRVLQRVPRRRVWALSGTPLENSVADLCGVFAVVKPGLVNSQMVLAQIRTAVAPYVLRRTKEMVAKQLPEKVFRDCVLELTPEQALRYCQLTCRARKLLRESAGEHFLRHVFVQILRLKQICNFDPVTGRSAKAERLQQDLEEALASGGKAIVFSQFVGTLRRLASLLAQWHPLLYFGGIDRETREAIIAEFRDDPSRRVLLLTYRAGGVGLNLQFAGYVFLFDRWWNPAVEDQAINRAHRLGSTSTVIVTRYLMAGTIEERIEELLKKKRQLFARIFSGGDPDGRLVLAPEEWLALFDPPQQEARQVVGLHAVDQAA